MNTAIMPLASESPVSAPTVESAKQINAKYSAGPKCNATAASGAATNESAVTPIIPAMNELTAAMASVAAARPFLASG